MSQQHEIVIPQIISALSDCGLLSAVEKIVLFGSRARGDMEPRSDIDLAVFGAQISRLEWLQILDVVENIDTLLKIDVVHFDRSSTQLQQNILNEGIIVYESKEN